MNNSIPTTLHEDNCQKIEKVKRHVAKIISAASPGDRITPELKLAQTLKVSHSTVRRAIDELVEKGVLRRKHGSGTYVNFTRNAANVRSNLPLDNFFKLRSPITASNARNELKFVTYEGPREIAIHQRMIQEFEHDNPNFHIKLESCLPDVNLPPYFYDIEAGRSPDIFYLNQSHLFWLIKNKFIHPIEDYIKDSNVFHNLDPFVKRAITYQNKIWCMPKNLNIFYLLYNKKIFDSRKLPYPNAEWTWEDYLNAARELTGTSENNDGQWFGAVPHRDYMYWTLLAWAFGGELVDSSGKIQLESDASMDALKFAVDLTMKYKVTTQPENWSYWKEVISTPGSDVKKYSAPFSKGLLAMCIKPGTDLSEYILNPDLDFGLAPLPSGPAGRHIPLLYSAWSISENNPCPSICADFLRHMAIDNNTLFAQNNFSAFVTRKSLESYLTPDKPGSAFDILMMKNHLREFPFHGHFWPFLMGHVDEMFKNIFLKKESIKKSAKEAAKVMQTAMDQFMTWIEK